MFSLLGESGRLCDGISRRELLRIGGLSALGLTLPDLLRASQTAAPPKGIINDPTFGRAKNIVYVWLQGGPPQHETFDPKPDAPSEIRGPFKPIQTNVPGIQFCELLPRISRMADKLAVVRSLHTDTDLHDASGYEVLTGYRYTGANSRQISPTDWPYFGSVVKLVKPSEKLPPLTSVWLPDIMRLNENVTPAGQTGGILGRQWDPDRFVGDPSRPDYKVEGLRVTDIAPMRLNQRISLLEQVQRHFTTVAASRSVGLYDTFQGQAFDLLTSGRVQRAFAIQEEPDKVRDRYTRTQWGQSLLLARRLIETGVRLVHVNWCREPGDSAVDNPMWDTHAQNADRLEDVLCPLFDTGLTALIEDLQQRGLLHETIVVVIGEFGRTPKINAAAGRDHWGHVFSFALAGAGICAGQVYGSSDRDGAYPARDAVTAGDLTATLFHSLGIDHESSFRDAEGRERRLTLGSPIRALLGGGVATADRVPPGGSLLAAGFDTSLLLNTDFSQSVPLYPVDRGSRPKGWRAAPLTAADDPAFGVRLLPASVVKTGAQRNVVLGVGRNEGAGATQVSKGERAILAQEMRNPRAGRFAFTVETCLAGPTREACELFQKHFACRLAFYRFAGEDKNPLHREELGSLVFQPPFVVGETPAYTKFEFARVLDSAGPGQNFSIGRGLGVSIEVEKTSEGSLTIEGSAAAALHVKSARLSFSSRTINDKVVA
ncbi:MAG TPA: DUF1501 domain-containing protein [Planctomycetaceae bacterium]|jgi:hypothetical protein|nr:DUF1501 domain-containing protein [Planctomycetaceae bacterium]